MLGIVLAGGEGKRLYPLTADRAKPAVPFGGAYRLIDFVLSNLVNAGYLRIYSAALVGQPATSTINWTQPNSDIGTTTTVAVDANGDIKVSAGGSGTHFIVDVIGYYTHVGESAG